MADLLQTLCTRCNFQNVRVFRAFFKRSGLKKKEDVVEESERKKAVKSLRDMQN